MAREIEALYGELMKAAKAAGQGHVFAFWDELGDDERTQLLEDLMRIDLGHLPLPNALSSVSGSAAATAGELKPAPVIGRATLKTHTSDFGRRLLGEGKVAALTVAGGQGTRLGFDGPKGAFPISPVRNKTLFQLFSESILATQRRYGAAIHWYLMTSPVNDLPTQTFLHTNMFFGLDPNHVHFFQQGVMPAWDRGERILLDQKHRIALAPDGHGGTLRALEESGMLQDMAERGIEFISYFQVDNPLVMCLDPAFIGLHAERESEMSSKALPKADDFERVGNFAMADDRIVVIEYSDLPEELARARNADGSRKFDAANIAIHVLSRSFVERLTKDRAAFGLPWHVAHKKVPHVELATGERIEPTEPNAVKLEAFIFDALPLARNPILLETSRAEEFSPVKNASGVDSVDTAKRDMNRRAANWLAQAGVDVPRDEKGEPTGRFEISPLVALDAEELASRVRNGEISIPRLVPGGDWYLGD